MKTIGIDIGGTNIKALIFENGKYTDGKSVVTPKNSPDNAARAVAGIADSLCGDEINIGIACAGEVDGSTGIITADNLGFKNVDFSEMLGRYTNKRFYLLQDACAASYAELKLGVLKGFDNALYLCFGTGVGCDVILNGKSIRKNLPLSCEIGHMITHPNGKKCSCGNSGCYERYASAAALSEMSEYKYSAFEIAEGAKHGEKEFIVIWQEYISELCIGLMNCMILYSPDCVCIGGGLSGAGKFLINSIKDEMNNYRYYRDYFRDVKIAVSKYGSNAGALGAAIYAAESSI